MGMSDSAFWQNPGLYKGNFRFAGNNYVYTCRGDLAAEGYKIKIEDTDGESNGGRFKTVIVPLKKTDVYPLCTNFSNWIYDPDGGFVEGYEPVKARLIKEDR